MRELIKRWNAKMPLVWAKVHKISLWLASLSLAGGVTDIIFGIPDNLLLFPDEIRFAGKAILTASTIGAIVSKLTAVKEAK